MFAKLEGDLRVDDLRAAAHSSERPLLDSIIARALAGAGQPNGRGDGLDQDPETARRQRVMNYLRERGTPATAGEIARVLDVDGRGVSPLMRAMARGGEVRIVEATLDRKTSYEAT